MFNQNKPSILRYSMPDVSLESIEILQIKCADFENALFVNNQVVQATLAQKENELNTLKQELETLKAPKEEENAPV